MVRRSASWKTSFEPVTAPDPDALDAVSLWGGMWKRYKGGSGSAKLPASCQINRRGVSGSRSTSAPPRVGAGHEQLPARGAEVRIVHGRDEAHAARGAAVQVAEPAQDADGGRLALL